MADEPSTGGAQPDREGADADVEARRIRDRLSDARLKAEELRSQAQARLDEERNRRTWVQITYEAWDMDRQRGGPLLSGGLAYRFFIWLVPFALLIASIVTLVVETTERSVDDLARSVGVTGSMVGAIGEAAQAAGSSAWWLLFVGLVVSLWAARGLARAIVIVTRIAWALPPGAGRAGTKGGLATWGILVTGLSLQFLRPVLFRGGVSGDVMAQIILFAFTLAVITFGTSLAPHRGSWRNVVPGALVVAVGLRMMGIATAVYFAPELADKQSLYGGVGIAIVILLFLFLCCRLFVWGQFLNARIGGVQMSDLVPVQLAEAGQSDGA